eukprot:gnl/Chilomastix_caulleri/2550.p1 GENE.gnl/Chilomastix_caulleri/2550~~gnl/Chilomastix_caulleri/2550.p1  ORF type:complete len:102 (+),score=20.60 gnl/Chilomastix_caulleri/2550:43-348(+)
MVKAESACIYAALILYDEGLPISESNMQAILKSVHCQVAPYWVSFFCSYFEKNDMRSFLVKTVSTSAPTSAPVGGSVAAAAAAPAKEEKKEEKKEEEKGRK